MIDEQLQIDFGTDELNDPQYEEKVDTQGDGTDGAAADTTPDGAAQQGSDNGAAQGQTPDGQSAGDEAGKGGAADASGQQQQSDGDKGARTKTDKDGNLTDAQGNIVAKAGAERRHYERVQAQASYITRLESELKQAKDSSSMVGVLNDVPAKLGLDMRETEMGLQAISSFKKDPVATARWMLQETMRLGYNLQQIVGGDVQGQPNGGSLDLQAVKSMIGEAVQPLVQDRTAQQQQRQAEEAAARDYDAFVAKHDHAAVHDDVLANMLQANTSLTPEVAYWQLREYASKNQLDFSKPLREQVAVRQQGGQQQQPQGNAAPQAQSQQPMPNGGAPLSDAQSQATYADADDAWDNIVNQSLREAGMLN